MESRRPPGAIAPERRREESSPPCWRTSICTGLTCLARATELTAAERARCWCAMPTTSSCWRGRWTRASSKPSSSEDRRLAGAETQPGENAGRRPARHGRQPGLPGLPLRPGLGSVWTKAALLEPDRLRERRSCASRPAAGDDWSKPMLEAAAVLDRGAQSAPERVGELLRPGRPEPAFRQINSYVWLRLALPSAPPKSASLAPPQGDDRSITTSTTISA